LSPEIFGLVLLAALLHAAWNAIVKQSDDPLLAQWLVIVAGSLLCLPFAFWFAFPLPESWPLLAAGVTIHTAYYLMLAESYRVGDLSQVYPLARGSAPIIVAAASVLWIDEPLSNGALAGVGIVGIGVTSLAIGRRSSKSHAVPLALTVGLSIGAYSVVDGLGVRSAGSPFSYIVWLEIFCGFPITAVVLVRRSRSQIAAFLRHSGGRGTFGGIISTLAYACVLWAYSVAPLASVSALRETSVIFGAAIGAMLLGEPFGTRRIAAAAVVAAGVTLLQLS
jgi:drug/metabolite transporter (DMT)-like permease